MNEDPKIRQAKETIGPAQSDDWKIQPGKHAEEFDRRAPALAVILKRSDVERTAAQYQESDRQANSGQARFKKTAMMAGCAVAGTAISAALILCVGTFSDLLPDTPENKTSRSVVFVIVSALAVCLGALATMWINRLRGGDMLRQWLNSRADAERRRLEYFQTVIESGNEKNDRADTFLNLLKLEYFRRFLLDSQIRYFKRRGDQHRVSSERTLDWSSWATCASTVFAGCAGILMTINPHWAVLAALGVAATSIASVIGQRENINQDRRNADQYADTSVRLEELSKRLSSVRSAVAEGDSSALGAYFAAAEEVLLEEHAQWIDESQRKSAAIESLEKALQKYTEPELPAKTAPRPKAARKQTRKAKT